VRVDKTILTRMRQFAERVRRLRSAFAAVHNQLTTVASHRDSRDLELTVGDLVGDEFETHFGGVSLIVRLVPEITANGVASSKVKFFEKPASSLVPPTLVMSVTMKPDAMSDLTDAEGDALDLTYYIPEAVMHACEIVLRKRAEA
jgi:hypothetical protein